jgi:uncharacterized Zn finger protein
MSERLNLCPECRSRQVEVVTVHNPDTQDMNSNATLKCEDCGHTWEGRVMSKHHRWEREMGFVI